MQVPIGATLGCLKYFRACAPLRCYNYDVCRGLGSRFFWYNWRASLVNHLGHIFPQQTQWTHSQGPQRSCLKKHLEFSISGDEIQSNLITTPAPTDKALTGTGPTINHFRRPRNKISYQSIHLEQPRIKSIGKTTANPARIHLYDHCAGFNIIPLCEMTIYPFEIKENVYRFSISCPAQNIVVTRSASSPEFAEALAYDDIKREIEECQTGNVETASLVKTSSPLNTRIAKDFLDFCGINGPSILFSWVSRKCTFPSHGLKVSWHFCEAYLNGESVGQVVLMRNRRDAEVVAHMTAAIFLHNKYPGLYLQFLAALERGQCDIGLPIKPIAIKIRNERLSVISKMITQIEQLGSGRNLRKNRHLDNQSDPAESAAILAGGPKLNARQLEWKSKELLRNYDLYCQDESLSFLRKSRSELPVYRNRSQILELVEQHPICIIVGSAGSGKSTQLPQILLENAIQNNKGAICNIICTQPRRMAAKSVAERVAFERNEKLQETVGYHVRFDDRHPQPGGSIIYCTTGVLLQRLQHDAEGTLDDISHIILDEVHERDLTLDFLLIVLKRTLASLQTSNRKPVFKLILMSATANTELFASYFGKSILTGSVIPCPVLTVPGSIYKVESFYLDDILDQLNSHHCLNEFNNLMDPDSIEFLKIERSFQSSSMSQALESYLSSYSQSQDTQKHVFTYHESQDFPTNKQGLDLNKDNVMCVPIGFIVATIAHIAKITTEGAILVFLPGLQEIKDVREKLLRLRPFGVTFTDREKYSIQMLHSSLKEQQTEVFKILESRCRKIILATSIAETSVTIPDIRYVIDSGLVRSKHYEQIRGLSGLRCSWISKSSSKQRAGRAGRVHDGYYYSLFTKCRYESLRPMGVPEIVQSDLQEICLDIKARAIPKPVAGFLANAIEPPGRMSIEAALRRLVVLKAIDSQESITPLGKILAALPVAPSLGKMILLGAIFRCLDPMLLLAAASTSSEVFFADSTRHKYSSQARMTFSQNSQSDHIAIINACREWREIRELEGESAAAAFASAMSLHHGALRLTEQAANQIETILADLGVIPYLNKNERFNSEIGHPKLNENSTCTNMMKVLILVGFSPNIAVSTGGRGLRTLSEKFTVIHPSSVNRRFFEKTPTLPYGHLFAYSEKHRSNDGNIVFLRHTTKISPLDIVMFGGSHRASGHMLMLHDWLPLYGINKRVHDATKILNYTLNLVSDTILEEISKHRRGIALLDDNILFTTFRNGIMAILEAKPKTITRESQISQIVASEPIKQNTDHYGGHG